MKRLFIAAAAMAALALGACATATPYQPAPIGSSSSGGYSEQQVEQNRWIVGFSGNSLTDRRTVETYLLYRAAELTQQQGFDWFTVVERQTDRDVRVQSTGFTGFYDPFYYNRFGGWWGPSWRGYYGAGYGWGGWGGWGGGWGAADYRTISRYEASAEILMGKGPKPADDRRAFAAGDVVARLGPAIKRPEPKS